MNIWDFSKRLTRRLLAWSVLSGACSALMLFSVDPFWRGLGIQFFAWGAIDAAIAALGARFSARKRAQVQEASHVEVEAREARWLERILWVNTGLDMLYVLGGLWLMQSWGAESLLWRGHGLGIVIQGGFLLFFDLFHARAVGRFIR